MNMSPKRPTAPFRKRLRLKKEGHDPMYPLGLQ